jgi:hypothetical protein
MPVVRNLANRPTVVLRLIVCRAGVQRFQLPADTRSFPRATSTYRDTFCGQAISAVRLLMRAISFECGVQRRFARARARINRKKKGTTDGHR